MPMVSWRPSCWASLSLVPTPSVPETSTGSRYLPDRSNSAPNPPSPPITSGRKLRSEEHTSELQSLMRISYAVFCLQKKQQTKYNRITHIKSHQNVHSHN